MFGVSGRVRVRVRAIFRVVFFSVKSFMLYFLRYIFPYCNNSPDSDITLTMKTIDATQETTLHLRSEKN